MHTLATELRRQLENTIIQAREVAEAAARSALQKRAVDVAEPFPHFGQSEKDLRTRLRARGRRAGDTRNADKTQSIDQLTQELAYEYWHRMLFARFLAENQLLMHPDGVAVSLEECEELAPDAKPPAPNGFVLAARYASTMLPEIFRTDDVLLEIEFAPEQRLGLEKLLASLPKTTFLADDSLGWVYQFWQSKKKEEVNKSGKPIDGRTLSAVTQLFTEHYMVEFLLHNTIGAWWAGRHLVDSCRLSVSTEEEARRAIEVKGITWHYLRFVGSNGPTSDNRELPTDNHGQTADTAQPTTDNGQLTTDNWRPAAGTFEGWPKSLKEFTMLDPCCGSGHFLVAAFNLLVPLRMHDEKLTAEKACEAVLRDNLFGLELDPRCTQIAAFALALAAWKYPDAGGFRRLPPLNIACSGQGVVGSKADWIKFASGDKKFTAALGFLYDEFEKAPTLGSLINPRAIADSIFQTGFAPLRDLLDRALRKSETQADPDRAAVGVAAQGIAVAASLMARQFTLVATNVPYLARGKQDETMRTYLGHHHSAAKADLATAFVERCLEYCVPGGSTALVTPENWLLLGSYKAVREWTLRQVNWDMLVLLGEEAWWAFGIRGPRTILTIHTCREPPRGNQFAGIDASRPMTIEGKIGILTLGQIEFPLQETQRGHPDCRISVEGIGDSILLRALATNHQGLSTGDNPRFRLQHWEVADFGSLWEPEQSTVEASQEFGGRSGILLWESGKGQLWQFGRDNVEALHNVDRRGEDAWNHQGVAVTQMRMLPVTLFQVSHILATFRERRGRCFCPGRLVVM